MRRLRVCWAVMTLVLLLQCTWTHAWPRAHVPFAEPRVLDPNRASIDELMTLPGLGRERARAVVLSRVRRGRFRSLDELGRVDGIGPDTVAQLRLFLRVDAE